jgi:hypothetical protein
MNRTRTAIAIVSGILLLAGSASAGPLLGYYESEFTGEILEGRWSESYAGGGEGAIDNTVHGASWDGTDLATQWELVDAAIDATPTQIQNTVDGDGNGIIVWYTTYSGGALTLTNLGPWWNSDDDPATSYAVDVTGYSHTTQVRYVAGAPVEKSTIVEMSGIFTDHPGFLVSFIVAQALHEGEGGTLPTDYPEWLPDGEDYGAWGVAQMIQMEVAPEPATMGLLGLGLGILILGAKRRRRHNT